MRRGCLIAVPALLAGVAALGQTDPVPAGVAAEVPVAGDAAPEPVPREPLPPLTATEQNALAAGAQAYEAGLYPDAKKIFSALLEASDHPKVDDWCDLYLGWMHADGLGGPVDGESAVTHLARASDHGMGQARYKLGWMAMQGKGVPQNTEFGLKLITESAAMGFGLASYAMAETVKEDSDKAPDVLTSYRLYQRAYQNMMPALGPARADILFARGNMLTRGSAGIRNPEAGVQLLMQSAQMGHLHAAYRLWHIFTYGDDLPKNFAEANRWFDLVMQSKDRHGPENPILKKMQAEHHNKMDPGFISSMRKKAEAGDWRAQRELGMALEDGILTPQSYAEAANWYAKAAVNGDVYSAFRVAEILFHQSPRLDDREEANKWYRAAAKAGMVEAMYQLGLNYYNGEGIKQDYKKAHYLFEQVLKRGNVRPLRYLAKMYSEGQGVGADMAKAHEMHVRMAGLGDVEARFQSGRYLSRRPDPAQHLQGVENLRLAAKEGHEKAMVDYAVWLAFSEPRPPPDTRAPEWLQWLMRAQAGGDPEAVYYVGVLALHGYRSLSRPQHEALLRRQAMSGPPIWTWYLGEWCWADPDPALRREALRLIHDAAEQGVGEAGYFLSQLYLHGREGEVDADKEESHRWLVAAAEAGHGEARTDMGYAALTGAEGKAPDLIAAERWIRLGAVAGSTRAGFLLGYMYEQGLGVTPNFHLAGKWYRHAAVDGHDLAQFKYGQWIEKWGAQDPVNRLIYWKAAIPWYQRAAAQGYPAAADAVARLTALIPPPPPPVPPPEVPAPLAVDASPPVSGEEERPPPSPDAGVEVVPEPAGVPPQE